MNEDIERAMQQRMSRNDLENIIENPGGRRGINPPPSSSSIRDDTRGIVRKRIPNNSQVFNDFDSNSDFGRGIGNTGSGSFCGNDFENSDSDFDKQPSEPIHQNQPHNEEDAFLTTAPTRKSKQIKEQQRSNFSNQKATYRHSVRDKDFEDLDDDESYEDGQPLQQHLNNKRNHEQTRRINRGSQQQRSSDDDYDDNKDYENNNEDMNRQRGKSKTGGRMDKIKDTSQRMIKSIKDAIFIFLVIAVLIVFCWWGLVSAFHKASAVDYNDDENPFIKTYRTFLGKPRD